MIILQGTFLPLQVKDIVLAVRQKTNFFREIKETPNNLMVTCPMHAGGQEQKASCGILTEEKETAGKTLEAGWVHCYSCHYSKPLPKMLEDVLDVDDGLAWIKNNLIDITSPNQKRPKLVLNISREQEKQPSAISTKVVDYYHQALLGNQEAIKYLQNRKINLTVAKHFKLGYNKNNNSIMIPITQKNKVYFYKERVIDRRIFLNTKGIDKARYLFGHDTAIKQLTKHPDKMVWICESEIDALTLYSYGEIAIAIMGSKISEEQTRLLQKSNIRKLIDGMDRDVAGRQGFYNLKNHLIPKGFRFYLTDWRGINKKDINELDYKEFKHIKNNLK